MAVDPNNKYSIHSGGWNAILKMGNKTIKNGKVRQ
jgi:hypothetical protein